MEPKNNSTESLEIAYLLKELFHTMKSRMSKHFEGSGLTATQGMVMGNLHRNGKMKVSDLSAQLGLSNSTTSGILDRMEKLNLIVRTRSEEDKRVVYVNLNDRSECAHKGFTEKSDEMLRDLVEKATPEEFLKIKEGLTIFRDILNR